MTSIKKYDIAIIGSGPGGYTAAIRAAQMGAKVALIEKGQIGGTCLNVGCIPTKSFVASSHLLEKIKNSSFYGIDTGDTKICYKKILDRKNANVDKLRNSLKNLLLANKIDIIQGSAKFIDEKNLQIDGKTSLQITADKIIIATGAAPLETKNMKFDCRLIHCSSSILNINELPSSLAIIGGGYIGCEFASFFSSLGTKVTIIEAEDTLLKGQDKDIIKALEEEFIKKGIKIFKGKKVKDICKNNKDNRGKIILEDDTNIDAEKCLLSIGRKLNLDNLGLENIKLECNENGYGIKVNNKMQTSKSSNIYAIGDITGSFMLAHVAAHEGIIAAENAMGKSHSMKYDAIPSVIFTSVEIASCGLTEECAQKQNIEIETAKYPLSYLGRSLATGETTGFVKIIIEKETKQIIGAHIFGHDASTMIAEISIAIANELTIDCLLDTIHAHPTSPEAWMEAGFLLNNTPIHYPPKNR